MALAGGVAAGWLWRTVRPTGPVRQPSRTAPYDHDEYLRRLDRLDRAYTDSIKEYDRLVTWISGGALGVSVTFAERLGPQVRDGTEWLLAAGWITLGGALLTSLWSQYASSRVHSWRRRELDHLQTEIVNRPVAWEQEARRLNLVSRLYGRTTKWLTFASGVLLVGGFMLLARYAFLNVSPQPANQNVVQQDRDERRPPIRVPDPVPEKRGLEDLPEPLPRPSTQTPTTGGSEKK